MKARRFFLFSSIIFALAPSVFAIVASADVSVAKSGPETVIRGGTVSYDITVSNAGPSAAANVTLTDALPSGVTFVSEVQNSGPAFTCSNPPVATNGTTSCSIASLAAGTSATFTINANISSSETFGTTIDNTATVSTTTADPNSGNDSSTSSASVEAVSDLFVTKTGPDTAAADTDVAYSITVFNNGPDPAPTLSLKDLFPAEMTFVSLVQNSGPAFDCSQQPSPGTNGPVFCTSSTLASGASATFTLTVHIAPGTPDGTIMTNEAVVHTPAAAGPQETPSNTNDPNDENNTATATTIIPSPHADLIVVKSGPSAARPDTDVSYTITVRNLGPDAASSVQLADTLPSPMTFVSFTQDSGPAFTCTPGATTTCTISILSSGATATFTLTGHVPAGTPSGTDITNVANASSSTPDPNTNNNQSATSFTVSSTDLAITKSGPATATAGGTISWTITVTNITGDPEPNPSFSDTLPPGTTFNSLVQNTGPAATCSTPAPNSAGTVVCSLQTLGAGASNQFTLTAKITPTFTGAINNTATVTGTNADPNLNNNSQTASTNVTASTDLSVLKSGPSTAVPGTDVTYTITLTNGGPSTATSVSLTDTLPANTTFVSESQTTGPVFSCTTPAQGSTGTITCSLASLDPSASATFSITVHVNPGATGSISNIASGSAATADPNSGNNSAIVISTLTPSADLSIVKTATAAVIAGSNVTYHIVVTNNGPSDASAVNMTDTLPPNTTFVSETQTNGPSFTCSTPPVGGTGAVSCSIATLTSGATAAFDIVVQFAAATPVGPSSNTANVSSSTPDPDSGNNSSLATTNVTAALADLAVTKTPSPGPYGTSQPLTYTIVATNNGPQTASSVTVTDTLPPGTTLQSSTPAGACSGTTVVTCNAATLASGATATFTLTILLPSTAGPITNTAVISASAATADPNSGNNTATSTITVIPAANIPMISPLSLLLLCIALAVAGAFVQKQ